jgi:hypothetical protein
MIRRAFFAFALALAALSAGPALAGSECLTPTEIAAPEATAGAFPLVAAALAAGRLDVLAIGSGTVMGARGRPEGSFADRMVQDLREAVPGAEIRLVVQGERGMAAAAMLAALRRDLPGKTFRLVVWQTGTVEAVRKTPPTQFAETLDDGAALVRAAGADLLLVDPQYSRLLQAHATLPPYQEAMRQAAARNHAVLFHRFDLIQHWVDSGALDLESVARADRTKAVAQLNACLGQAMAEAVLRAAQGEGLRPSTPPRAERPLDPTLWRGVERGG